MIFGVCIKIIIFNTKKKPPPKYGEALQYHENNSYKLLTFSVSFDLRFEALFL
jgi:hypothetical protein